MTWKDMLEMFLKRMAIGVSIGANIGGTVGATTGAAIGTAAGATVGGTIGGIVGANSPAGRAGELATIAEGVMAGAIYGGSVGATVGAVASAGAAGTGAAIGAGVGVCISVVGIVLDLVRVRLVPGTLITVQDSLMPPVGRIVPVGFLPPNHVNLNPNPSGWYQLNLPAIIPAWSPAEVKQNMNDCWLMATVASLVSTSTGVLQLQACFSNWQIFTLAAPLGGWPQAKFHFSVVELSSETTNSRCTAEPKGQITVRVDATLSHASSSVAHRAGWWCALLEKAFSVFLRSSGSVSIGKGWSAITTYTGMTSRSTAETIDKILGKRGGLAFVAQAAITGQKAERQLLCKKSLWEYVNGRLTQGRPVTIGTLLQFCCCDTVTDVNHVDHEVQGLHEYAVTFLTANTITLQNQNKNPVAPAAGRTLVLGFDEFYKAFRVAPLVGVHVTSTF
jgi:hypothetical protein